MMVMSEHVFGWVRGFRAPVTARAVCPYARRYRAVEIGKGRFECVGFASADMSFENWVLHRLRA